MFVHDAGLLRFWLIEVERLQLPRAEAPVLPWQSACLLERCSLARPHEPILEGIGGPRKQADQSSIFVLRADGSVVSRRQSGFLWASLSNVRLMPGDAIVVPEDFERTTWMKDLKDWAQIFFQFGLGVAALEVLRD